MKIETRESAIQSLRKTMSRLNSGALEVYLTIIGEHLEDDCDKVSKGLGGIEAKVAKAVTEVVRVAVVEELASRRAIADSWARNLNINDSGF